MQKIEFEKLEGLDYYSQESFKALRANLQFCGSDIKTILFTSCTQGEGKTTVAFHLAEAMAENGKSVVLVDTDLRKSMLMGRYKVGTAVNGIAHYLSGQCNLDDVLYSTNIDDMYVVLCSKYPPNPAELLGHENFHSMIEQLREIFDYIIIDSPPLGMVIDSAIMAPYCDGTVLVIESNKINRHFAQDVKAQLNKSGCKLLGVVLNKVETKKRGYYRKYKKYYGKYYRNQE